MLPKITLAPKPWYSISFKELELVPLIKCPSFSKDVINKSLPITDEILKSFTFSKFIFLTELSENKSVDINSFSNSILKDLSFIRYNPLITRSLLLKSS